ncbi:hypothetical protein F7734_10520 [Scytonema sp. UIC 10036]|uniref:hypothetical protein n=1 Tax=Scytonema sp. UIC 10036 TaxID=2304196 RepID=UPI0012DAEDE8|nr:hypothetical protein [Scytonema sp. UIC 10036]MUG92860.1 hypothetical protein [Scytonema sp. UIC 10036]
MNTNLIGSNFEKLLSPVIEEALSQPDITPPSVFLANLVIVLVYVTKVNPSIDNIKKEQLISTLTQLSTLENKSDKIARLLLEKISNNPVKAAEFTKARVSSLTAPYSGSEKLLLISLCYKILAAMGIMDDRKKQELRKLADWMGIEQYIAVLETGFDERGTITPTARAEIQSFLKEDQLDNLGNSFVRVAFDMLEGNSTKLKHQEIPGYLEQSPDTAKIPPQPKSIPISTEISTPNEPTPKREKIPTNATKPSDIFPWEPKTKTLSKQTSSISVEDATGKADF